MLKEVTMKFDLMYAFLASGDYNTSQLIEAVKSFEDHYDDIMSYDRMLIEDEQIVEYQHIESDHNL